MNFWGGVEHSLMVQRNYHYHSEMVHHRGVSLSEQQTAGLIILSWHTAGFITAYCYTGVIELDDRSK